MLSYDDEIIEVMTKKTVKNWLRAQVKTHKKSQDSFRKIDLMFKKIK